MDTFRSILSVVLLVAFFVIAIMEWPAPCMGEKPGPRCHALVFIFTCLFCTLSIGGFCSTEDDEIPVFVADALLFYFCSWAVTLFLDRHFYLKRVKSGKSKEDEPMNWERILLTFFYVSAVVGFAYCGIRHLLK